MRSKKKPQRKKTTPDRVPTRKHANGKPESEKGATELERLRDENKWLLKALYAATKQDFDFNKKELLAQVGKREPLGAFLDRLEKKYLTANADGFLGRTVLR